MENYLNENKPLPKDLIQELIKIYPPVITQKQLEAITGFKPSKLEQARLKGGFIPYVKIGRSVRYRLDDVVAYLEKLPRFNSTTEAENFPEE